MESAPELTLLHETPASGIRTLESLPRLDALADSVPRVSPVISPVSSPRLRHPQPQTSVAALAGHQGPSVLVNSGMPSPAAQRHPSPQPQRETRPFASLTGAPGGTRSMSNLTQARSPGGLTSPQSS